MDKQYSVQFFTKFVEAMQKFCRDYIEFEQAVELSGYLSLEIDNYKKERYVLSEMVHNTGDVISESYCVKAFKTMKRLPQKRDVVRDSTNIKAAGIASSREVTIDLRHSPEPRSSHHTVLQSSFRQRTANSHHLTSGFSKSPSSQPHNNISGHSPLMSSNKRTSFAAGAPNQMAEKHSDSYDSHASGHDNQEIMEIQPRHSIQISTNQTDDVLDNVDTGPFVKDNQSNDVIKSQKRNLTKSDDGPLVKKDKTDGDLDSLINAATRINPISEADSDTLKSVCETETKPSSSDSVHSDNQSISLTSESIRLPLPENIEIKKEVNDIVLLDSPDNGGDNSDLAQLQVTFGVPDSNVSDSTWNTQTQPTTSKPKFAQNITTSFVEENQGGVMDMSNFQRYERHRRRQAEINDSEKIYRCDQCSFQSCFAGNLMRHKRKHTGDLFRCHLCSKGFYERNHLEGHLKAHAGTLNCEICGKTYSSVQGLGKHRKTHNNPEDFSFRWRPYQAISVRESAQDSNLLEFGRMPLSRPGRRFISSSEKSYKCDQCSFQTSFAPNLNRHKRKHSGDFFSCHLCPKFFYEKNHLDGHLKAHAGMLKCEICGKNYSSTQSLGKHRKLHRH